MSRALVSLLVLAGCSSQPDAADTSAGAKLEQAAEQAGLVVDPARASIVGSWSRDTDRVCVVPGQGDAYRIGALIDYGEGQGCVASGTATRSGNAVRVRFGGCRFEAGFDGDRIVFPADLPDECETLCTGRASLAALTVDRLSESMSEAATLRTPSGRPLCTD